MSASDLQRFKKTYRAKVEPRAKSRTLADMRTFGVLLLVLSACSSGPELVVIVEGDPQVIAAATRFSLEVQTQEGEIALQDVTDTLPIRRVIAARGGDASRVVTISARAADNEGQILTTARAIRDFRGGDLVLRLYAVCLGTNCPTGLTCEPTTSVPARPECVSASVSLVMDGGVDASADGGECAAGQTQCSGLCSILATDEGNCGDCGVLCSSTQVCLESRCQVIDCDVPADCPTQTWCNQSLGRCASGCDEPSDCGDNEMCNLRSNRCECSSGYNRCGGRCVLFNDLTACGTSCEPCQMPNNGVSMCLVSEGDFVCERMCNTGFHLCDDQCRLDTSIDSCGERCDPCPTSNRGAAVCVSGECALDCQLGATLCELPGGGQDCVDVTGDPQHCGDCETVCTGEQICVASDCVDPPNCDPATPGSCTGLNYCDVGTMRCRPGCDGDAQCGTNGTCNLNSHTCDCATGFHRCSGSCVSNLSVNSCGLSSCEACPLLPGATAMSCNGTTCLVMSCSAGYVPNPGQTACDDVNECLVNNGGCATGQMCINTPGGRTCGIPTFGSTPSQTITLPSGADGVNVVVSPDGTLLMVGDKGNDDIHVYQRSGNQWATTPSQTLTVAGGDEFGIGLAATNDRLFVGDSGTDRVHMFVRSGALWSTSVSETVVGASSSSSFGVSVAVTADGTMLLVGDSTPDQVFVYQRTASGWGDPVQTLESTGETSFGRSMAVSDDGQLLMVGDFASAPESVFVFTRNGPLWNTTFEQRLTGSGQFGDAAAVSRFGQLLAVGDSEVRQISIYQRGTTTPWNATIRQTITAPSTASDAGDGVCFSPDGQSLIVVGTSQVLVFSVVP